MASAQSGLGRKKTKRDAALTTLKSPAICKMARDVSPNMKQFFLTAYHSKFSVVIDLEF